jgi:hypothetical protein
MSQLGVDRLQLAKNCLRLAAGAALGLLLAGNALADEVYAPSAAITLPNGQLLTAFDISFDDPVLETYFLADRTNKAIDVVDTRTNTLVTQLLGTGSNGTFQGATGNNNTSGPDGVLTVNHQEVWAGDGNSTVKVINLLSQQTTHVISTGGANRADELCWDPRDHLILVANDAESPFPFVSFISTDTYAVVGKITMDGSGGTPAATNGIEQCQWSFRTGMFYLNIPEVNGPGNDTQPGAVLVISPQTMSVVQTFNIPLSSCAGPQGMALGPENQILLGCNDPNKTSPSTVIINEHSGAVMHVLAGEDGSDQVTYNHEGHYFLARSGGATPQQLGVVDAQNGHLDTSVADGLPNTSTSPHGGNHSVAADPIMNQVYVPIASSSGATICSSVGGIDMQGCIAVLTVHHN